MLKQQEEQGLITCCGICRWYNPLSDTYAWT